MQIIILFGILIFTFSLVTAKRAAALIRGFRCQSLLLFLATLFSAIQERQAQLFIIAASLFILKVAAVPYFLYRIIKKIKVKEDLGLLINAQLSLAVVLGFGYLSWAFARHFIAPHDPTLSMIGGTAFFMVFTGIFLMIFRMTAMAQIIGLLVMENGLFLLASTVSGGMPFFVEIAIFFDVFVSVVIMNFFVYRINKLFTHIDVNKLSRLKG